MRKRVKICGITNLDDALMAIEYGADALGFVFYEKSPRYISPQNAMMIIEQLPPFIEKVGLFVEHSIEQINQISFITEITLAQIHFEPKSEDFYDDLLINHIKVIRATSKEDILKYQDEYRLVDAFVDGYGGEGKRVKLDWFSGIDTSKIILAGGLNSDNLNELRDFNFYGVDVSSAVESKKGKKDSKKIKEFILKATS